jgi:hypothetical protein
VLPQNVGGVSLAVALGDASVRILSFTVSEESFARTISPFDHLPLGSDWQPSF